MKTIELTGAALDWVVARCEGFYPFTDGISWIIERDGQYISLPKYSTDWAQGGPIIEREKIGLDYYPDGGHRDGGEWGALRDGGNHESFGPTPLIAAMRCYVMSRLGDEVDIPEELK